MYFSKKKGKALYILKAAKDYTKVKRKRKREFDSFDPDSSLHKMLSYRRRKTQDKDNRIPIRNLFTKKKKKQKDSMKD